MLLYSQASHNPQIMHLPLSLVQKFRAQAKSHLVTLAQTHAHTLAGRGDLRAQADPDGTVGSVV